MASVCIGEEAYDALQPPRAAPSWLNLARHGAEFLRAHGQALDGNWYFSLTRQGRPLEWDQKLWWVHLALIALLMGYTLTRRSECWDWFERLHAYTWEHFPDPAYGEWFGYLNRQGQVLLPLKGGKWKGCFHLPRALLRCWKLFEELDAR